LKRRRLVLTSKAQDDLRWIYDTVAQAADAETALRYIERIETHLRGFEYAAERGTLHSHIREGLRIVGFERRVTIAFVVPPEEIVILRLFYAGADWQALLSND
jgi:toxin ParE1/3/4